MNGSMPGLKKGFTFLELIVVIAILGILATIIVPNFRPRNPEYQRKQFIDQFNSLLQIGWQNALATGKVQKIIFNKKNISLESETEKKSTSGESKFEPIKVRFLKTNLEVPENFEIKNLYVGAKDEMKSLIEGKGKIWFYITPDGLAQNVILNIFENISDSIKYELSLVLNPFSVQFKEYDKFQKPK